MWKRSISALISILTLAGLCPAAYAQWAVVDVGAIAQLVQQVQTMKQQLETAQTHLVQAQQQYESMTGGRGMERLLNGVNRNYLPADWNQLANAVSQAGGAYSSLSSAIQSLVTANAVLTAQDVARLSPAERAQLQAARQTAATLQTTANQALTATSARFASLQQLIDAIGGARDEKAVLDLQARIAAEQSMLQNEHTKLDLLFQAAQAQEWTRQQQAREQAIAGIGSLRQLPPLGLSH